MKKKLLLVILAVLILTAFIGLWKLVPDYSSTLEANWGISLPVKALCKEVYENTTDVGFHGDGIRYHVFSYKYEDYIDLMFAWSPVEHETLYYSSVSEAATAWLNEINVPKEHWPDFSQCATWHKTKEDNSEILFFWDSELNRLYVVENIL